MPYRAPAPERRSPLDIPAPPRRRAGPVAILVASAAAHVGVLGALAYGSSPPPQPKTTVVRVLTAEAHGGVDGPMTLELTGFRRARVRAPE